MKTEEALLNCWCNVVPRRWLMAVILLTSSVNCMLNWPAYCCSQEGPTPTFTFCKGVAYQVGEFPEGLVFGDLDGDTDLDLIVPNQGSHDISILLNNGDGGFGDATSFPIFESVNQHPKEVALGDFDNDADIDLAVLGEGSSFVGIMLNDGSASFSISQFLDTGGEGTGRIVSGDFDGDKFVDIVATTDEGVSVLLNDGNGGFLSYVVYEAGVSFGIAKGDLDGDEDFDLATSNILGGISVLLNNGDGTFSDPASYSFPEILLPRSVTIGDLDDDSDLDAVITGSANNHDVGVLENDGNGVFQTGVTFDTCGTASPVVIGDMDGDFDMELLVPTGSCDEVLLFENLGGSFASEVMFSVGDRPIAVAVGDLDADGDIDFAAANALSDDVVVLLNGCDKIILGDVNLDRSVNLLDVAPFVFVLSNRIFQAEADTNQDGSVDLLDVAPFIDLLTAG